MPAASRSRRTLLAIATVTGLLAVTAPIGIGAGLRREPAAPPSALTWGDLGAADATTASDSTVAGTTANEPASVVDGMSLAQREARAAWLLRTRPPALAPQAVAAPGGGATSSGQPHPTTYAGRNHVWIPGLGISRSISFYSCSSSYYPGNRVYRWGCAGSNNIYLFGHASSVFRALHDAYVGGRLAKGMKLYYANASGTISTYAVSWWKLTTPSNGAWAYAAQSTPSLTLQTCVGAQSQYRLIVRLRKVG